MTQFVYPRLPLHVAQDEIKEIRFEHRVGGLKALAARAAWQHPKAVVVPTGGHVADEEQLEEVRGQTLDALSPWLQSESTRKPDASFDRTLGKILHDTLRIIPSDAAHEETWSFLSLVVFPEVSAYRYPKLPDERLRGAPRNPLRYSWMQRDVLGSLQDDCENPLGTDELVGLFERSALARNRGYVRALAREIVTYNGERARSEWTRDLLKEASFVTGPRLLDALSEEQLQEVVSEQLLPRIRTTNL